MAGQEALSTSHPGMEAWRPQPELSYGEVAGAGATWGIAMHAIISFFAVAMPSLEPLLIPFRPAEQIALFGLASSTPLARWLALMALQGVFWALSSVALLGISREIAWAIRTVRLRSPRRSAV